MNNNILQAKHYSFWSLLNEETIVVPEYQREYAYGRSTGDAPSIRKELISELIDSVVNNRRKELNFVYGGEVDASENHNSSSLVFHLVDGQQRLTTLLIFYWYVFLKAKKEKDCEKLSNFQYKTRLSSRSFFDNLLKVNNDGIDQVRSSYQEETPALSVIIQVFWVFVFKKKLFLMTPLHHNFEKLGWKEQDIVKLFWIVGLILGTFAVIYGAWL